MHITDLGGHSGCKILLCETEDDKTFVRKISSDKLYNERLRVQTQKQESFQSDFIKTPAVLNTGMTKDGLFFFDMEYIRGITLAEYMKTIEVGKVRGLVEAIVQNMVSIKATEINVNEEIFTKKIDLLKEKLSGCHNPVVDEALYILECHSWKQFVQSSCHGDLTLENIIVRNNQLYLIDFLDSFYDCWIMDISTLMQDVQTMWTYRNQDEINSNTLIRLIIFRDVLIDKVKAMPGGVYLDVYYALLLKLVRIYPYTNDKHTYEFLNEKIESIISIIRKEGAVCVH